MATRAVVHTEKDFQTRTNEYAADVIASIRDDLDALAHAQECNGKPCKRGFETRRFKGSDGKMHSQLIHNNPEAWHDEDAALTAIKEGHYGIQVRDGWRDVDARPERGSDGLEEYIVILDGGGPASRITGDLDRGEPDTAYFEFQDWFTPWTRAGLSPAQRETLLDWVRHLYFGE